MVSYSLLSSGEACFVHLASVYGGCIMCQRLLLMQAASYLCPQDAGTLAAAKYTTVIFVSTLCC